MKSPLGPATGCPRPEPPTTFAFSCDHPLQSKGHAHTRPQTTSEARHTAQAGIGIGHGQRKEAGDGKGPRVIVRTCKGDHKLHAPHTRGVSPPPPPPWPPPAATRTALSNAAMDTPSHL
jgi:hypothetical protein